MSNTDDGGLAFPQKEKVRDPAAYPSPEYFEVTHTGMSLRDWFAGNALSGIVAGLCANGERGDRAYNLIGFNDAAKDAYTLADAMIAARKGSK